MIDIGLNYSDYFSIFLSRTRGHKFKLLKLHATTQTRYNFFQQDQSMHGTIFWNSLLKHDQLILSRIFWISIILIR